MKHLHIFKTSETEFRIITNSIEFCWSDFLDGTPVEVEIYKITTITKLPNGQRLCKIFSAV